MSHTKGYYAAHREEICTYQRKYHADEHPCQRVKTYHKSQFCSHCGKAMPSKHYSYHYCSPYCYFRSFDKYRS